MLVEDCACGHTTDADKTSGVNVLHLANTLFVCPVVVLLLFCCCFCFVFPHAHASCGLLWGGVSF